ncbi:tyrosine recombinase XerC [Photobacterium kishitanii]|uniref:site-specific integrase n=1 Tax=Photobacterium kishitanii TaxID=318456 RepID=UPI0009C00826|nr:tyrosine-type recombinase/integrase [Photobacterium kishitanii]
MKECSNKSKRKLPSRVYAHGRKYRWHPKAGGSIAICSVDAPLSLVWLEYEKLLNIHKRNITELFHEYFDSLQFKALAPSTQRSNLARVSTLIKVFGNMNPNAILPKHIRAFMDKRGEHSTSAANNDFSLLSKVMQWSYERGKIDKNPCRGVRKFSAKQRDRYITDEEYLAVYQCANTITKVAMELAYLCAARKGDILKLEYSHLLEDGIFITQSKTGKKQIKMWSPRLREAITLSETLAEKQTNFVLRRPNGQKSSRSFTTRLLANSKKESRFRIWHQY